MAVILKNNREVAKRIYAERGFQHRVGYGKKPAIINVDLANAWTRDDSAFACAGMDDVITKTCELLEIARRKSLPIFFTTTAYDSSMADSGLWVKKIPALKQLIIGSELCEIDPRLERREGELVIVKKMASAFAGTGLDSMLTNLGVDTVIVTGVTASACVRHTVEDAVSRGFRPIIPEETISDRIPDAVEYNLFDIDAKFGDVEPIEKVKKYLEKIDLK
jgi:N-carbamoylsarcosine amidase